MAANLVSPQNKIVDVDGSTIYIEWIATQPQKSFEVQYRLHSTSSWSTCGIVNEPNTRKYSVMNIYNLVGCDFYEVYYRLVIRYEGTNGLGNITGTEISPTYSLIFRHGIANTLKLYDGVGTLEYPIFNTVSINNNNKSEVDVQKIAIDTNTSHNKLLPIAKGSNATKSNLNVNVASGDTRQISYSYAAFTTPAEYGSSYFEQTRYYNQRVYAATAYDNKYTTYYDHVLTSAYTYYHEYGTIDNISNYTQYGNMPSNYSTNYSRLPLVINSGSFGYAVTENYHYYSVYYYVSVSGDWLWYTYNSYRYRGDLIYEAIFAIDYFYDFSGGWGIDYYYTVYGSKVTYEYAIGTAFKTISTQAYHAKPIHGMLPGEYVATTNYIYNSFNSGTRYYRFYETSGSLYSTIDASTGTTAKYVIGAPKLSTSYATKYAGLYKYYSGSTALYNKGYYVKAADNSTVYYTLGYYDAYITYSTTPHTESYTTIMSRTEYNRNYYYGYNTLYLRRGDGTTLMSLGYEYNTHYSYYSYNEAYKYYYTYMAGLEYYIVGYNFVGYNKYHRFNHSYRYNRYVYTATGPDWQLVTVSMDQAIYDNNTDVTREVTYHANAIFTPTSTSYNVYDTYPDVIGMTQYVLASGTYLPGTYSYYITKYGIPVHNYTYTNTVLKYKTNGTYAFTYDPGTYTVYSYVDKLYYHI